MAEIPRYQEILDELNQMDWGSLYQESISTKERVAYIKVGKQRIRHVKTLLKQEKDFIKARYDNRNKAEAQKEQIALLPYLALDSLISKLELSLAELVSALDTHTALPDPYVPGEMLVEESSTTEIRYLMMSHAQFEGYQRQKEEERQAEIKEQMDEVRDQLVARNLRETQRVTLIQSQMDEARRLITAKEFEQARAVLQTVNDPQAQAWLVKVDALIVSQKRETGKALRANLKRDPYRETSSNIVSGDATYSLVCPKCTQQSIQHVSMQRVAHEFSCPACHSAFTTNFYHIRASRSRGFDSYRRTYNIRVLTASGSEQLLNFSTQKNLKLELRSKDFAGFTYLNGKLAVVQNFTVKTYWQVTQESVLAWLLTAVAIAIFIVFYLGSRVR